MSPRRSRAFGALPGYPLADIPEKRRELAAAGVDVIDLGAGDADLPAPPAVVERMRDVAGDPAHGRYPFQLGLPAFREAVAGWMDRRFGVSLDPWTELLPLIGSKEGIAKLPLAFLDPGDVAVVPDPGYQAYRGGVVLAGGTPHLVPLRPENDFLVPLPDLPADVADRARLVYLNYPNNPTAASASLEYLASAVEFCRERDAVLVHDHAYSEIAFDGYRPPSVLEVEGAREVAVEFHSFSKTYNMTGWRLGWAAGSRELVAALARVKSFMDTGVFLGIQAAGVAALESWETWVPENVAIFRRRRECRRFRPPGRGLPGRGAAGHHVPLDSRARGRRLGVLRTAGPGGGGGGGPPRRGAGGRGRGLLPGCPHRSRGPPPRGGGASRTAADLSASRLHRRPGTVESGAGPEGRGSPCRGPVGPP